MIIYKVQNSTCIMYYSGTQFLVPLSLCTETLLTLEPPTLQTNFLTENPELKKSLNNRCVGPSESCIPEMTLSGISAQYLSD